MADLFRAKFVAFKAKLLFISGVAVLLPFCLLATLWTAALDRQGREFLAEVGWEVQAVLVAIIGLGGGMFVYTLRYMKLPPEPPPAADPGRPPAPPAVIPVRVIGLLDDGYARVVVGPGAGLLRGGSEQDWPLDWLPPACRRPNAEGRWVNGPHGWPPQVEPVVTSEPALPPDSGRHIS